MNRPERERQAPILELRDIHRGFRQGAARLDVLTGATLAVHPGEMIALLGPSGAGKSTLLHIAGLLETPEAGRVVIDGVDVTGANDRRRTRIRRTTIGFVYQFHHLLPEFSALDNVVLPQRIAGISKAAARERARSLLDRLGLGPRLTHRPSELSGGEQQRVAIARALANGPGLLLADEPTGNLDPRTADLVHAELVDLARQHELGVLIATHNLSLAQAMDRIVVLKNGHLVDEAPAR